MSGLFAAINIGKATDVGLFYAGWIGLDRIPTVTVWKRKVTSILQQAPASLTGSPASFVNEHGEKL